MAERLKAGLPRNVIALSAVSLLTDVSSEMIYPLLPLFLTTVLGASTLTIGAIEGSAESVASLLKLVSGWWSDRVRRRKPLVVAGYGLASIARPLVGLVGQAWQVLALRLVDRVGKGVRTSPRDALIADSVDATQRGRAFGFHRASDHAGAVIGPLVAFALLRWSGLSLRAVFLLAAIPAALAMVVLVAGVRERHRADAALGSASGGLGGVLPRGRFRWFLGLLVVFTLGNSSDAFLLLRANELGVTPALTPILWAMLHVVKSSSSTPGGALSDRIGRRPLIVSGWIVFALVYLGFAFASATWHAWVLFAVYGVYFGLTEGVEKALVADLVAPNQRGAAFGWYNLAIGIAALPASLLFGYIWERAGSGVAFGVGAGLALTASLLLPIAVGPQGRDLGT